MKLIRQIIGKNIWLKISVFNALAVFTRIAGSWLINKLIAIYIGPSGTGLTEQFRNFLQTTQGIATLGLSEGVTKYTAKYETHNIQLTSFLATIYKLILSASVIISFIMLWKASFISMFLFNNLHFINIIRLTALTLPFIAFNLIFLAVLTGFQEYKKLTYIQIFSQIFTAIIATFLIINYHLIGALLVVLSSQIIHFIVTLFTIQNTYSYFLKISLQRAKKNHFKRLYSYILMALVTAITAPLFSILIRNQIFDFFNHDHGVHAGYWDGVKKISGLAMAFIMPVFSLYYYPQIVKANNNQSLKKEMKKFFIQIFPLLTIGFVLIYLLRKWVILLFFSKAYLPMEDLLAWQLAGDLIRVSTFTLAYIMLAKAHSLYYILTEIGFWFMFYILSHLFLIHFELIGVVIAYFITYIIYAVILIFLYRKYLFTSKSIPI